MYNQQVREGQLNDDDAQRYVIEKFEVLHKQLDGYSPKQVKTSWLFSKVSTYNLTKLSI